MSPAMPKEGSMQECPLCGCRIEGLITESDCQKCKQYKECEGPRCPNCYYENVLEPAWYEGLRQGA